MRIRLACNLLLAPACALIAGCSIPDPGPFYATQAQPTAPHGTLLAATPYTPTVPGADAYKIVYNSEAEDGAIVAVSGVVFIPTAPPPPGGRNTVAWAHPTTGIAAGCAPSLDTGGIGGSTLAGSIPGLQSFIDAGDVVTATDYQGLGEPGIHPYLIGNAEGQDVLDSVLAARTLPGANLSGKFVLWGHSQGGHAVLFAGQLAKTYTPGLSLAGIAAAAPVTDNLGELTEPFSSNTGRLLHSYIFTAYSQTYHVPLTSIVAPQAVPQVEATAGKCINGLGQAINAIRAASNLSSAFIAHPPQSTPPWPTLFSENSPGQAPPGAPLLIVQGTADPTVEPHWTEAFAATLCARHETLDFQELQGVNHLSVATKALPLVTPWITARFAGAKPPDSCPAA